MPNPVRIPIKQESELSGYLYLRVRDDGEIWLTVRLDGRPDSPGLYRFNSEKKAVDQLIQCLREYAEVKYQQAMASLIIRPRPGFRQKGIRALESKARRNVALFIQDWHEAIPNIFLKLNQEGWPEPEGWVAPWQNIIDNAQKETP